MRRLAALFLLFPLIAVRMAPAQPVPQGKPLSDNGVLIGANTEPGSAEKEGITGWKDAAKVKAVIARDFGLVQTTAYPAWGAWTGTGMHDVGFNIAGANEVINWAKGQGKKTCVHLLTGSPTYFPAWLNGGAWRPGQLDTLLDRWITHAVTGNGNAQKVDYWNVVNEAFMWNGNYWDSSSAANTNPWHRMGWEADKSGLSGAAAVYTHHPVYIRRAFEMARRHTQAKLEIRDYYIEFWDDSRKSRAFYQLVKHLLNSGVPLHAVGFQGHFRTDFTYDWSKLRRAVEEYRKLGLEVYITEADYGDTDHIAPAGAARRTPAWDSLQAKQLRALATAAVGGGINWICMWGVADNANDYWRKGQSALLFDENYAAKPAYYEFRQGLVDGLTTSGLDSRFGRGVGWTCPSAMTGFVSSATRDWMAATSGDRPVRPQGPGSSRPESKAWRGRERRPSRGWPKVTTIAPFLKPVRCEPVPRDGNGGGRMGEDVPGRCRPATSSWTAYKPPSPVM